MVVMHAVSSLNMGGAERFVIDLSTVQKIQGLVPVVLSMGTERDVLVAEARALDIEVHVAPTGLWRRCLSLLGHLRRHPVAVLHIHSPGVLKSLGPILPLIARHCRIVYTRHGTAPLAAPHWRRLHRWSRRWISALTFVSNRSREVFQEVHEWPASLGQVIDNGVLVPAMPTGHPPSSGSRLGSVGRLVELKGQRYLLEALGDAALGLPQRTTAHFYGDGPLRDEYQALAATLGVDSRAHFHGNVMDRDVVYGSFDILVVCSESEGLSLAIMEAMARGLPVVATDVGGNGQLVKTGVTGILVPYADSAALARAINQLLADPVESVAMGNRAREHVARHFSLDETARRYRAAYALPEECHA